VKTITGAIPKSLSTAATPGKESSTFNKTFSCRGKYGFINNGIGKGEKMSFAQAWKGFEDSFTSARIPCESIKRYPVVARWRNDVDFVAAGIFCFQPYCVTGELDPPANPLICPQFCARFNDLDNIGITGRHYSGFVMMGIQVFNYPDDHKFFKDECLEFNHRWLTETLKIDPDEITYIEDVWAGGGNLGPSIEYFVHGLEVGNMVFMQYKTFHDGSREELDVKVIDVGIGLERVAWLINGSATSYSDTFAHAMSVLQSKINVEIDEDLWSKFGPYSCTLNIDEVDDIEKEWCNLADKMGEPVDKVKHSI
jgi:alanyl-tRNA synthetase